MERQCIDVGEQTLIIINGPLILLSLTANIFYASCLIFCNTQRLKQPLKMLLAVLVWCSIIFCVSLVFLYGFMKEGNQVQELNVAWGIVECYMNNSMSCSVLLIFYYYMQIVPAQRALLIWVKRNIKHFVYMALLFNCILFLISSVFSTADAMIYSITYINSTLTEQWIDELYQAGDVCITIVKVHTVLCLCIMTVSSFSTVHYLQRHIRRVAQGTSYSSTPKIQSQIRVTISGLSQGVLYFLYAAFTFFDMFTFIFSLHFFLGNWITFMVATLYISGTTVNLGIGQTLFRQKAADVWKALKALCGVGMVTNDVKMHSRQLTSSEVANTVTVDVQMSV